MPIGMVISLHDDLKEMAQTKVDNCQHYRVICIKNSLLVIIMMLKPDEKCNF